ncbi:MAG: hypothetical protein EOL89_02360 [Actinobacteria bacterium]|nr:hypothetical protein [Actinomycetota bacterium]
MNDHRHGLTIGQQIQLLDGTYDVVGQVGVNVKLRNTLTREYETVAQWDVVERLLEPVERPTLTARDLDTVPVHVQARVAFLRAHLEELETGAPVGDGPRRPEYDPEHTTQKSRLAAKAKELSNSNEAGRVGVLSVSVPTLKRWLADYRAKGPTGLIDGRAQRESRPLGRCDERLISIMVDLIAAETKDTKKSPGNNGRLRASCREEWARRYPGETFPTSESSLRSYLAILTDGKYTFGPAKTQQTNAKKPKGMYQARLGAFPGQEVQIDSSKFDIMCFNEERKVERMVLVMMIDKATNSILATGLRPKAAKGFDISLIIAQAVVPRPLRAHESFNESELQVRLATMPWAQCLTADEVSRYDTKRPFIFPSRIVTDNGADYMSDTVRSTCQQLGISLTHAVPGQPTDKALVERAFDAINKMFAQHVPGFTGGDTKRRGTLPESDPGLLDVYTLAELFDRWVTVVWQNTPHEGLRDPVFPRVVHTPNSMYAAMFDVGGFIPLPLRAEDYFALLPVQHRRIKDDGITINYRRYDSVELNPFRGSPSPDGRRGFEWPVRYHPYDPATVWLERPDAVGEDRWIACDWMNKGTFDAPFSRETRDAAFEALTAYGAFDSMEASRLTRAMVTLAKQDEQRLANDNSRREAALKLTANELGADPYQTVSADLVNDEWTDTAEPTGDDAVDRGSVRRFDARRGL